MKEMKMNLGMRVLRLHLGMVLLAMAFSAQAKIEDFNGMISENLQTENNLRQEVKAQAGLNEGLRLKKRQRIVMEDTGGSNENYVAASSNRLRFEKEKRRAHSPQDRRSTKRLATEMGQFEGQ